MKILDLFKTNKLEKELNKLAYVLDLITQSDEGFQVLDDIRMTLMQTRHRHQDNNDIYDSAGLVLNLLPHFEDELIQWKANRNKEGE